MTAKNKRIALFLALALVAISLIPLMSSGPAQAQSGNQWRADYYNNPDWAGAPVYTQFTNFVSFNWGLGSPSANVPVDYFTARYTTNAFFYAGTYQFSILADDEFVLYIDGVQYANTIGQGQSGKTIVLNIPMTQASHTVQVDYRELVQNAYITVNWIYIKPGIATPIPGVPSTPTPVPSQPLDYPLVPQSATSVVTEFGDYTPCIQNNQQQAACFQTNGAWNSPNLGSIQSEPQITVWGNCQPADSDTTWTTDPNTDPPKTGSFRCSKTLAGWFPK